ncbi:50S ribosomal protein L9 [Candidatus Nitrosacidococcus tergens]|uniref:Large ribosomal subunit protein bL9 n=1 Tax=Candidatus Nitrosacidococcus tergens TaxID=553981 RepID=A0A7G1Q7H3_9GAMM|nr:50S ribosomal protein L9 [Candidatus Nitrosacidococcus tergens]CAB1274415.1 50S ribosomal subunit protein L9 [Candidatus Nitrosacidococcus tergens]
MEIILLEQVLNLGTLGHKVSVKSGYARNYLIPNGKAVPATKENEAYFESRRAELEKAETELIAAAEKRKQAIESLGSITISANAGAEGKLFGSISATDIAAAMNKAGVEVHKKEIRLPDGLLRQVGDYNLEIYLHLDVFAPIKVIITAES